jgi:hypothetical protein
LGVAPYNPIQTYYMRLISEVDTLLNLRELASDIEKHFC